MYSLALPKGYSRHTDFTQVAQMKKESKEEDWRENCYHLKSDFVFFFTFEIGVILIAACIPLDLMFF